MRFSWNGAPMQARPGDSIAAALTAAGVRRLGSGGAGQDRAMFCGIGVCQDCAVQVDGQVGQLACMTKVAEGMSVCAQEDLATTPSTWAGEASPPEELQADTVVIGAGPAGLSAALILARAGAQVIVLDERDAAGGQFYKPRTKGFRGTGAKDPQHRAGDDLRRAVAEAGIVVKQGQTVWHARADGGFALRSHGSSGGLAIAACSVLLATGGYELPPVVPGWTRSNVLSIGGAQTLVRRYGVVPPGPVLIAGHGPLGWQLADEILSLGGTVAALAERGRLRAPGALLRAAALSPALIREGLLQRRRLALAGVPVLTGWELAEVTDAGATLRKTGGTDRRFVEAQTICIGSGFAPQMELARLMGAALTPDALSGLPVPLVDDSGATSVPGLWIAGDAGGMGGAPAAEAQGALAGSAIAAQLGLTAPPVSNRPLRRARRFQAALWSLFHAPPPPPPDDDATVCRCEAVDAGRIRQAIRDGARDPGALKRATRMGMGRCQGRYCLPVALRMLSEAGQPPEPERLFAPQLPAKPVPVSALGIEKPEWGGHRESAPAARPGTPPTDPLTQARADLVVIGGGITGISAALYAARAGARVSVLERGWLNAEASGGNAGSLHLQLLSWDFGQKAVGGGDLQLRTLPLQQESIALWRDLERTLNADFEMATTGGLMVAETEAQIPFLEQKARSEARVGITTEVIGPDRLRQIAPSISDRMIAAAWCPGEGKINPLAASLALIAEARRMGVHFEEQAPVSAIARDGDDYAMQTARGTVTAPRVLVAAGGWSAQLGAMLGATIPAKGAPLQMVVTERTAPVLPCLVAHADRHLTMKQTQAGTVLIGGAWTAETGPGGQSRVLPDSLEGNLWAAARTVPAVGGLRVLRSWAAMNIDIDGAPLIGPLPGHPRVTVAATANGYTLGPLMGREAAQAALNGQLRQDLTAFSFDRFNA
ncbi:FAD-dependent oxidoreductase [Antarctobacter jejuensis]|uniref:FAD-dependent oxidoreductase n=1 Tax=Antarctobacter jejuensis TaxID=1439938 RepID=UPI003FD3C9C4